MITLDEKEILRLKELLAQATEFEVGWYVADGREGPILVAARHAWDVDQKRVRSWVVYWQGHVLNRIGDWEIDPRFESRTQAFIDSTRHKTLDAALTQAREFLKSRGTVGGCE